MDSPEQPRNPWALKQVAAYAKYKGWSGGITENKHSAGGLLRQLSVLEGLSHAPCPYRITAQKPGQQHPLAACGNAEKPA